ncbi:MAG: S1/P1 nuclease [Candidatus Korobacteraceae bacterium]
MRDKLLAIFLVFLALCPASWGWGHEGHQIIATVAEDHLDETTKVMIQSLLGNNHLYSIASWADDVRRERPETKGWHYVDIPLGSRYDASRDCAPPDSCVVAKINDFSRVLTDKSATRDQRAEALKFIVHFVGDIHQPLHAVKESRGGNGIHVQFLGDDRYGRYECNLHGVWDTDMIVHTGLGRQEYAQHLEDLIQSQKLASADSGTPEQWANESAGLAGAAWMPDGTNLDEQYYQREIKVVDRLMALAGLRLAKLLNDTIGRMTPSDFVASNRVGLPQAQPGKSVLPNSSVKVWVNTRSGIYHCSDSEWYGRTKQGEYMTQAEAQENGYRPVSGKVCH